MNQLTLFNAYAAARDWMEDAVVSSDQEAFERRERLALKIDMRMNGRGFCPICGAANRWHNAGSKCPRAIRHREQRRKILALITGDGRYMQEVR
jgi:hypothetical protein